MAGAKTVFTHPKGFSMCFSGAFGCNLPPRCQRLIDELAEAVTGHFGPSMVGELVGHGHIDRLSDRRKV